MDDPADPFNDRQTGNRVVGLFVAACSTSPGSEPYSVAARRAAVESAEVADATKICHPSTACRSGPSCRRSGSSAADWLSMPDSPEAHPPYAFEVIIDRLVELFTAEAIWGMPLYTQGIPGRTGHRHPLIHFNSALAYSAFWHDMRLIFAGIANGQPGFAMYMCAGDVHLPFQLHVGHGRRPRMSHVMVAFPSTPPVPETWPARFAADG